MTLHSSFVELWTSVAVASLEASALILIVLLIQRLLRRPLGPTWSFALWFVVLLRLSLPTLPVSSWTWPRPIESLRTQLWTLPATLAPVPAVPVESAAVREPLPSTQTASGPVAPFAFGPTTRPESAISTWARLTAWLWLLGVFALAARHWLGLADHPEYVPRIVQWTRRQHGPFPAEFIYRAEPGVRIHGRVLNQAGEPLSGALVRLRGPQADFKGDGKEFLALDHLSVTTDADGRWSVRRFHSKYRARSPSESSTRATPRDRRNG